jgi:hypothetical protein
MVTTRLAPLKIYPTELLPKWKITYLLKHQTLTSPQVKTLLSELSA